MGHHFSEKTFVKDISDNLNNISLIEAMRHTIHCDHIKAHVKAIPDEERLNDPEDLDLMSMFLYQRHERLRGGLLHYSNY